MHSHDTERLVILVMLSTVNINSFAVAVLAEVFIAKRVNVPPRFVSLRYVSFRYISLHFVSSRFVSLRLRFVALKQDSSLQSVK